jgi:monovalent cation/proton antiporter MnhG/PhaG subunit
VLELVGLLGHGLVWLGVLVVVLMSIGLAATPALLQRLHLGSAVTTPGCLLVCLGLACLADTWHDAVKLVVIGVLLVAGGSLGASVVAHAHQTSRPGQGPS